LENKISSKLFHGIEGSKKKLTKIFFDKKLYRKQFFFFQTFRGNDFATKNLFRRKTFSKKFSSKLLPRKWFCSKKIFVQKIFQPKKFSKKKFIKLFPRKWFCNKKIFRPKNISTKNNFSTKKLFETFFFSFELLPRKWFCNKTIFDQIIIRREENG
jgi:hypothetical protein